MIINFKKRNVDEAYLEGLSVLRNEDRANKIKFWSFMVLMGIYLFFMLVFVMAVPKIVFSYYGV